MMHTPFFHSKQILVIDQAQKNVNDRTWCFWEQQPGMFEEIVYHKWKQIDFYSNYFSAWFDILPYEYKMIRGIDFYNHILEKAEQHNNIHFLYGKIQTLENEDDKGAVMIDDKKLYANLIFNSVLFQPVSPPAKRKYLLLQHFKGWMIETDSEIFDDRIATFMDFRIEQKHGTAFVYMLPVAKNKALVEYTLITENLLQQNEYDEGLKMYIEKFLKIKNYSIIEEEFGIIPMTNQLFSKGEERIVNIGTAGGQTKASSGFTFSFIQKHCDQIISAMLNNKDPHIISHVFNKRFNLYDSILLNILCHKKMNAAKIFTDLFKKNPPQRVLRFLNNETHFAEELKIMSSVPAKVFLPVAISELLHLLMNNDM